jgi:hypothetical protein
MTAIEIIECMCYLCGSESMGTFFIEPTPNSVEETLINMFVTEDMRYVCDGIVHTNKNYLYRYDDRLRHPKRGEIGANAVVELISKNGVRKHSIYLYEVE